MIKIAICDDDFNFLNRLKEYLKNNLKENAIIYEFTNGYDLLEEINTFDFLFLDFEMPLLNGLEVLEKFHSNSTKKIMITNFDYIVFNTYKYNLYWFIRKQHFNKDMSELIKRMNINTNNKKMVINSSNKSISIPLSEIIFINTDHNYIIIHTEDNTFKIRSTFNSIIKQFLDSYFIIPTNGIIINMNYIKYIDFKNSYVLMYNNDIINISRSKKNEVKEKYGKFNI